ncbi:MAG: DedA family protein [Micrococcales bacterium]|nr:DedA family protein [Micrococcales bacterium]
MNVAELFQSIPPILVCVVVALVVGIESAGIPLPGEVTLITAAVLSSTGGLAVSPLWLAVAGAAGAITGDSTGYAVGHRLGRRLLAVLQRRFPAHFSPELIAYAEHVMTSRGVWAVFFGRFVALLRMFAGPVSGVLRMPYHRFLPANALGALLWAFGTIYATYYLGTVAQSVLQDAAWVGLAAVALLAITVSLFLRRRVAAAVAAYAAAHPDEVAAARLAPTT